MIPRPPRATRTDTLFPTRRSSDLDEGAKIAAQYDAVLEGRPGWSNRTSYVISPAGEIVHAYSESNPNRHVAETLAALDALRSEEHTSELQSLIRISYAVFCLKKKNITHKHTTYKQTN